MEPGWPGVKARSESMRLIGVCKSRGSRRSPHHQRARLPSKGYDPHDAQPVTTRCRMPTHANGRRPFPLKPILDRTLAPACTTFPTL